jgi:hypothetical protein
MHDHALKGRKRLSGQELCSNAVHDCQVSFVSEIDGQLGKIPKVTTGGAEHLTQSRERRPSLDCGTAEALDLRKA